MTTTMQVDAELLDVQDSTSLESPTWDDRDRTVSYADLKRGRILRFDPSDASVTTRYNSGLLIGSFGICASGAYVIAHERVVVIFDPDAQSSRVLVEELDEPAGNRYNDGRVGPDGCFWVTTRDGRRDQGRVPDGNGGLYRIDPRGNVERKATGFATGNGLAFSPDGGTLYCSDSHNGWVDAWDFEPRTGEVDRRRRFATLTTQEGRPDGAACDTEGDYWSAGVSGGCVNRFAPDGRQKAKLVMPCPKPTMVCFADDVMYLTSMRFDLTVTGVVPELQPADVGAYPHDVTGLFRFAVGARGLPAVYFDDSLS